MSRLTVLPFEPDHLRTLVQRPRSLESCSTDRWVELTLDLWKDPGGLAWSIFDAEEIILIGMVFRSPVNPSQEGLAAVHTAEKVIEHPLACTRIVKAHLEKAATLLGISRVYASVISEWDMAKRWIRVLGFETFGKAPNPFDANHEVMLYVRTF